LEDGERFQETSAEAAQIILFETDELSYVRSSGFVRRYGAKCLCITETDTPTFALPGLYAANATAFLTRNRTETMSYFISERARGNPAVKRLVGQAVEKIYLYSFMGGSNSWPRRRVFKALKSGPDAVVEATNTYNHWSSDDSEVVRQEKQRERYAMVMAQSKFTLCPRGCGLSSYRLFESMSLGVAPVIIADKWRPIEGIDWSFALFVPEARIPRLDEIVRAHESEWEERGRAAVATYNRYLAPQRVTEGIYDSLIRVQARYSRVRESAVAPVVSLRVSARNVYWVAFDLIKQIVLQVLHITKLPAPVMLRHPLEDQIAARQKAKR
jgi:hypothetical protein